MQPSKEDIDPVVEAAKQMVSVLPDALEAAFLSHDIEAQKITQKAVQKTMGILVSVGIDARLSEYWRGGDRLYAIVLLNVRNLQTTEEEN